MRPESHTALSLALCSAVWNWINVFPQEFCAVITGTMKLEGAPERVYDSLYLLAGSVSEGVDQSAFWPTMSVLLAVSPIRLGQAIYGSIEKQFKRVRTPSSSTSNPRADSSWLRRISSLLCQKNYKLRTRKWRSLHSPASLTYARQQSEYLQNSRTLRCALTHLTLSMKLGYVLCAIIR